MTIHGVAPEESSRSIDPELRRDASRLTIEWPAQAARISPGQPELYADGDERDDSCNPEKETPED